VQLSREVGSYAVLDLKEVVGESEYSRHVLCKKFDLPFLCFLLIL
jgi:hypothetical protein